jgi:hypothetical protein
MNNNAKKTLLNIIKEFRNTESGSLQLCRATTRIYDAKHSEFCKTYTTLDDPETDFSTPFSDLHGIVYCRDKYSKAPVWITPREHEGQS